MGTQVTHLIAQLQASLNATLNALTVLTDDELDASSAHPCATRGTIRSLLTHNIDHERMHVGQVYSARYGLKQMQSGEVDRLLAETLRARADLIAALIGLSDDALDAQLPDEDWTMRQMIEHAIYWERHSIDDLIVSRLHERLTNDGTHVDFDVTDPIYGKLSAASAQPDRS
jgi:uncharacterized damage-inducible protein DinB